MGKFVIRNTDTGVKFDLKDSNGEIIATSQVYRTMGTCKKGIASVRKNALAAAVEDRTVEDYKLKKHPKFEIFIDKADDFRFRLKAPNGQIIAASQAYKTRQSCQEGIESVRRNVTDAEIAEN